MQNMTLGNPLRLIITFSIPLLISNLFQQLYSISDIILVGRLIGVKALAAVGAAAPVFFLLIMVSIGFTNGLTVISAQSFGAKNYRRLRRSVTTATTLSLSFTVIFSAIMLLFLDFTLHLMNVPEEIYQDTKKFLLVIGFGGVMIVAFNLLSGFMRALGDSKSPLYFLVFTTLMNILLNVVFIYYMKMGVEGSALGTVTAMTLSVICCLIYMKKHFQILKPEASDWKLEWKFCVEHLRIAVPMAIQFSIIAISAAVTQTICNKFGFETIAAMTAAMRVEQLAVQPMVSLGIAMATFVAQNYGAGRIGRVRRGVFESSMISVAMSIVFAILMFWGGKYVIGIFVTKEQPELIETVISMALTYLNISILFYVFLGQIFIFRNSCQGMGNSIAPMISSIVELLMRIFAAIYLASKFGFVGLCYASPLAWIGGALVVSGGYFWTIKKINRQIHKKRWSMYNLQ
ncbi:MAG: MATE family efflux transporter [Alphaproteobacteria bacterium]|nr:MATE family efflux transporter [Alphaproteobacteria bacterium]